MGRSKYADSLPRVTAPSLHARPADDEAVMRARRRADKKRPKLYANTRWRKLREEVMREHPLCAECERQGRVKRARAVDHIIPHQGHDDPGFWDRANLQPLCFECHYQKSADEFEAKATARRERGRERAIAAKAGSRKRASSGKPDWSRPKGGRQLRAAARRLLDLYDDAATI